MVAPEDWTIGQAAEHYLADLAARCKADPDDIDPGTVRNHRSKLNVLACCDALGADLTKVRVRAHTPEQVLVWYAHVSEHRGKKRAWAVLLVLRAVLEFVRRRGVAVAEVGYIKKPAEIPVPPSRQRRGGRQKPRRARPSRLSSLPKLSASSSLRLAVQHLLLDTQRRLEADPPEVSPKTLKSYEYFADKLEETAGEGGPVLAEVTIEELTEELVADWYYLLRDKISRSTAAAMVGRLSYLLKWVSTRRRVRLEWNPTDAIRKRNRTGGPGYVRKDPRPFDVRDLPKLRHAVNLLYLQRLSEGWRRCYTGRRLAYFIAPIAALRMVLLCGARIGEIARIAVRDIHGDAVFLPQTKTHDPRWIYLDPEAAVVAARQSSLVVEGELFADRRIETFEALVVYWLRKACELVGLDARRTHDLRHTYVHVGLKSGIPLHKLMLGVGHTSEKTTLKIYGEGAERAEARHATEGVSAAGWGGVRPDASLINTAWGYPFELMGANGRISAEGRSA